jgi:glycerophosphoryl diester phosphodiesterase
MKLLHVLLGFQSHLPYYARLDHPVLVGHRGSPAYRPEHTLESYALAIELGADIIEPDLVITKDGHLVARHENEIGSTTNVASRVEFASRKTSKIIDGVEITGWFTEDFTLAELKTLFCKERIPMTRPNNTIYNGKFRIPTLQEVIALAKNYTSKGRVVGIYPETKHPSYFQSIGKPLEPVLVKVLEEHGWNSKSAPVVIQSFEVSNLKALRLETSVFLAQLIGNPNEKPFDFVLKNDSRTYASLVSDVGFNEISSYADGIGIYKEWIIPRTIENEMGNATTVVSMAHKHKLLVHLWTFRPENEFLPIALKKEPKSDGTLIGDGVFEILKHLEAGIDGFFTDAVDVGREALKRFGK